jgi:hypothetical protein
MTGLPNIRLLHQKLYNVSALEKAFANARRLYMDLRDQEERRYYAGMSMTSAFPIEPRVVMHHRLVFIGVSRPRYQLPFATLQRGPIELQATLEQLRHASMKELMVADDQAAIEEAIEMLESLG